MRLKLIIWEKEHGLKGKDIAEKLGISPATWSNIKNGRQSPTLEQIEKLRTEFDIDNVLDLLKEEQNEEKTS